MELKHIILFSLELFILLSAALLSTSYLLYKLKSKQKPKNFSNKLDSTNKTEAPVFDNVFHEVVPASAIIKKQISKRETGLTSQSEKSDRYNYSYQKPKISIPYNEYSGNRFERI